MADNAEDFIIRLHEQISPAAKVATSAVAQLEAQIAKQASVVSGYEAQLAAAAQKLQMLGEGDARGAVNVASFRRQQQAVAALQQKVDDARASMSNLAGAAGVAAQVDALKAETAAATAAAAAEKKRAAALKEAAAAQGKYEKSVRDQQNNAAKSWNDNVAKHASSVGKQVAGQKQVAAGAKAAAVNLEEIGGKLVMMGGPLGTTGGKAAQLGGAFQKLGALGPAGIIVGITVAVVALAAAIGVAIVAATKMAITMADTARNQALAYASLAANYSALADIGKIAPKVAAATGLATDEITALAEQLAKAKLPAQHLEVALKAMATAKAGGATTEFLAKLQKSLIETGKIPKELAEQFAKFQAIAGKKMLSLDAQSAKFKSNVAGLFSGLKIDGFLEKMSSLVGLFDANTASGRALKMLIEQIFQPIIDGAANAIPRLERQFLKVLLVVLKLDLAIKKAMRTPDGAKLGKDMQFLYKVLSVAKKAIEGLALALGLIAGASIAAGLVFVRLGRLVWEALGVMVGGLWSRLSEAWSAVKSFASSIYGALASIDLMSIGQSMIQGLANGITAGAGAVVEAMKGAVMGAINQAKALIKPGSPSIVFTQLGRTTGAGLALGMDQEVPNVKRAMTSMVAADVGAKGEGRKGAGAKGGHTYHFDFTGSTFGEGLDAGKLEAMMIPIFQRSALALEGE